MRLLFFFNFPLSQQQQTNQAGSGQKKNSAHKPKASKSKQREQPQTLNLSLASASNMQDKKLNLSQISNNKFEASPISQILHSTNSPQGGNRSFLKDKSMTQNQTYYTPRTGNQSCNSLRNVGDSLNTSNSFVNVNNQFFDFNCFNPHCRVNLIIFKVQ